MTNDEIVANGDRVLAALMPKGPEFVHVLEVLQEQCWNNWRSILCNQLRAADPTNPTPAEWAKFRDCMVKVLKERSVTDPEGAAQRKSAECEPLPIQISPAASSAASPPQPVIRNRVYGTTKAEVLSYAKARREAGASPRELADIFACAKEDFDASQVEIVRAVGRSATWVSHHLTWRQSGCTQSSPHGPTTRAGRASRRKHNNDSGGGAGQLDDEDGDVSLVRHNSPPCSSALPTAPVNETLPGGSAQTEPLSSAKVPPRETQAPKTQSNSPLEEPVCQRSRNGNRQREKEQRPARNATAGRKPSLASMVVFLDALRECPIVCRAAEKAGIHRKTPAHWIKCSKAGREGYELEWRGETWGFHDHYETAIEQAHDEIRLQMWQIARGIRYKTDPSLVKLGYQGVDAFATDEDGNFIEEVVGPLDPKMIRFCLEQVLLEYGKNRKSDIPRTGGVLVVGQGTGEPKGKNSTAASVKARKWKSAARKVRPPEA
jgi:hypothetical protein